VLDEVQAAVGAKHAAYLGQGAGYVGDRAHRPGGQDVVDAPGLDGERLPVQADELDGNPRLRQPFSGEPPAEHGRVDGIDPGHRVRIVRNVEPGPEPDLHHLAG
jgi:hypothetical protein